MPETTQCSSLSFLALLTAGRLAGRRGPQGGSLLAADREWRWDPDGIHVPYRAGPARRQNRQPCREGVLGRDQAVAGAQLGGQARWIAGRSIASAGARSRITT